MKELNLAVWWGSCNHRTWWSNSFVGDWLLSYRAKKVKLLLDIQMNSQFVKNLDNHLNFQFMTEFCLNPPSISCIAESTFRFRGNAEGIFTS